MAPRGALEIRQLSPEWAVSLAAFFSSLEQNGDAHFFHPHPFTEEQAKRLCEYTGQDLYYIAVADQNVVGYGMLRGWDEGYEVPSLGIAVHPRIRGLKIGLTLMEFLHAAARFRGAKRIRLKVYRDNVSARKLYEGLGYKFKEEEGPEIVGFFEMQ